jgi:hypothetical protein
MKLIHVIIYQLKKNFRWYNQKRVFLIKFNLLSINQIDECHISQDQTQKNKFSERSSPGRQVYSFI